jgi:hypothetical protein
VVLLLNFVLCCCCCCCCSVAAATTAAAAAGTVHTHVLAWKVDLDIAGTQNSLNMINFKVGGHTGI